MTPIRARSRRPTSVPVLILSRRPRASPAVSTGVLPVFTTCLGPRTELAGLNGTTWPTTSQSNSMRMAARCCFDGRRRVGLRQLLDVGGHHHRLDLLQRQTPVFAPVSEPVGGHQVGHAGVRVADVGGEEFPEPGFGFIGAGEQDRGGPVRNPAHRRVVDGDQLCIQVRLPE